MIKVFSVLLCAILFLTGCTAKFDVSPANETMAAVSRSSVMTRDRAQTIALEQVGLSADQVDRLHTEYEVDDGVPRYEVQFDYDGWEYDYEIHAETGAILSFDKDRND